MTIKNITNGNEFKKVLAEKLPKGAKISVRKNTGTGWLFSNFEIKIEGITLQQAAKLEGVYHVNGLDKHLCGGVSDTGFEFIIVTNDNLAEDIKANGYRLQMRAEAEAEESIVVDSVQFVDSFPAMASEHMLSHFAEGFGDSFKVVENDNGITVDILGAPSKMNAEGTTEEARQAVRHSFEMSAGYADFIHDGQLYESKKDKDGEPVPVEFYAGDWDVAQFHLVPVESEEEQTPTETPETAPETPQADTASTVASVSTVGIVKQAKQITQATPATPVNVLEPQKSTIVNKNVFSATIVDSTAYNIKEGQAGEPADLTNLNESEMVQMKTQNTAVKYENLKTELLERLGKSKGKLSVTIKKRTNGEPETKILLTGATLLQASKLEGFIYTEHGSKFVQGAREENGVFFFSLHTWDNQNEKNGGRLTIQAREERRAKKEAKAEAIASPVEIVEAVTPVEIVEVVTNVQEVAEKAPETPKSVAPVSKNSKGLKKLKKMEQKAPENIQTAEQFVKVLVSILPKGAKVSCENGLDYIVTGTTLGWASYLEGVYTRHGEPVHLVGEASKYSNTFKMNFYTSEELPENVKNFGYPLTNEQSEQKKNKKNGTKVA